MNAKIARCVKQIKKLEESKSSKAVPNTILGQERENSMPPNEQEYNTLWEQAMQVSHAAASSMWMGLPVWCKYPCVVRTISGTLRSPKEVLSTSDS